MSPQTGSRRYTHTHLKWFMGTLVFSTLHCRDFSFLKFLFSFLCAHKKHKNANKRISDCFPLTYFLSTFLTIVCLFAFLCFCLVAFLRFGAFGAFVACKIFSLKNNNKKFKTALITLFVLLLCCTELMESLQLSLSFNNSLFMKLLIFFRLLTTIPAHLYISFSFLRSG